MKLNKEICRKCPKSQNHYNGAMAIDFDNNWDEEEYVLCRINHGNAFVPVNDARKTKAWTCDYWLEHLMAEQK